MERSVFVSRHNRESTSVCVCVYSVHKHQSHACAHSLALCLSLCHLCLLAVPVSLALHGISSQGPGGAHKPKQGGLAINLTPDGDCDGEGTGATTTHNVQLCCCEVPVLVHGLDFCPPAPAVHTTRRNEAASLPPSCQLLRCAGLRLLLQTPSPPLPPASLLHTQPSLFLFLTTPHTHPKQSPEAGEDLVHKGQAAGGVIQWLERLDLVKAADGCVNARPLALDHIKLNA